MLVNANKKTVISAYLPQMLLLAAVILVLGRGAEGFLTLSNLRNVLVMQVPFLFLLSMGMTISVVVKGLDLSIGANMALSSCVAGLMIKSQGMAAGIAAGILAGCLLGAVNGLLIAKVKLPAFIATYGMDWIGKGLCYVLMMGTTAYGFPKALRELSSGETAGISNLLLVAGIIYGIYSFILYHTVPGRNIYAIGLNLEGARFSGVMADRTIICAYIMNGFLAAVTGLLYIGQLDAVDPTIAEGWNIKLIAAVLIGGASMSGGKADLNHTLLGVLILSFLTNGINLLGISSLWQQLVIGLVIICSIFMEKFSRLILGYREKQNWIKREGSL